MKVFIFISFCAFTGITAVKGSYSSSGNIAGSYDGGMDGYSKTSNENYGSGAGGYGAGGYAGPKSSAVDALKSFYNTQDGYNNYNFGYDVQDYVYNNYQSRQESGNPKGQVTGSYALVEPDGSKRTVNYVADWVNGFRATVSDKNGVTQHGYNSGYGDGDSYGASKGAGYGAGPAAGYSGGSKAY